MVEVEEAVEVDVGVEVEEVVVAPVGVGEVLGVVEEVSVGAGGVKPSILGPEGLAEESKASSIVCAPFDEASLAVDWMIR